MHKGNLLSITPKAASELNRQAAFARTPGVMHLDFVEDTCGEGWLHLLLSPGENEGVPISRVDGVTLFAPIDKLSLLNGLCLSYYADMSGGGFLISAPNGSESCACGAGFRSLKEVMKVDN